MPRPTIRPERRARLVACFLAACLPGCAALQSSPPAATAARATPAPSAPAPEPKRAPAPAPAAPKSVQKKAPPPPLEPGTVVAKNDEFVLLVAGPDDTAKSLARRYLGNEELAWRIEDFNPNAKVETGSEIVVPLTDRNPVGVYAEGYKTVPILCYHRFGDKKAKMVVTPKAFAEQMEFLTQNGYHVVRFKEFAAFLSGRRSLPRKAVLVTIDDGYKSSYQVAYPILKRYGVPATIFVYTDFIGAGDGLNWPQLEEMAASRLVDLQPHSKTHADLALRRPQETPQTYAKRIRDEVIFPAKMLGDRLHLPMLTFAYPYGDANDLVATQARDAGYELAVTVLAGGNPFYAHPFLVRRTMIFGEDDLDSFRAKLDVFHPTRPQ